MAIAHASPGTVIDVRPLKEMFSNAETRALVKTGALEVLRLVMPAGKKIAEHKAPLEITVQCLEGKVLFTSQGQTQKLTTGEMIFLGPGEPHALHAIEDSSLLVTMLLGKVARTDEATVDNWLQKPLAELCDYIEQTHHTYLKQTLPSLSSLIAKVVELQRNRREELLRLQTHFISWRDNIINGMADEERSLFPAIRQLERQGHSPGHHVNSIVAMIRPIRFLHEDIAEAVRMVQEVSPDSILPPDTCPEFAQMHELLRQVESDVRDHVRLEESILFPRAIELEASSGVGQAAVRRVRHEPVDSFRSL